MSFLLGLAGFLLTIGIIVIVHEGGHFFTAKFFNIKVTRFSFGMGPVLWRRRKGETEYCFSALPLGGYVRMADEADADLTEEDRSRLYTRQARWKRGLVLFAGPATNFILAFFLYVMVGAIGMPDFAAVMGTPPAGTQAASENVRQGDRVLSVNGAPVLGITDMNVELFGLAGSADIPVRFVNGAGVSSVQEAVEAIGATPTGSPVRLTLSNIRTPETERVVEIMPVLSEGRTVVGIRIRALPEMVVVRLSPVDAVAAGWRKVKSITTLQARGMSQMATGEASTKNLTGPIGIADMAGDAVRGGFVPFLEYLALISIAIGFMNLIPVPVLDGGQLVVLGLEGLRGRDFSERTKNWIGKAGFGLMLVVFAFAMNNDLTRLFEGA